MKKLIFIAVIAIISVSCKKDYNCVCTASGKVTANMPIYETTKKDAKVQCNAVSTPNKGIICELN